jgi:hypothetical protein
VTAPASGNHFTYTNGGDGQVYTISAASMKAGNGGGGATTTGNGATAANGGATATGAATSPTTSAKSNGDGRLGFRVHVLVAGLVMSLVCAF